MWKELDDLASVPLDSSSDPVSRDSVSEMLMSAIRNESNEKEQPIANPKPEVAQTQQQFLPPILREYTEAVDKCTKSASEFIRCAALISEAREAYEKLRQASAEIRKVLDSDEAKLRSLMDQAQNMADVHVALHSVESFSERKSPESSKVELLTGVNGEKTRMGRFP